MLGVMIDGRARRVSTVFARRASRRGPHGSICVDSAVPERSQSLPTRFCCAHAHQLCPCMILALSGLPGAGWQAQSNLRIYRARRASAAAGSEGWQV